MMFDRYGRDNQHKRIKEQSRNERLAATSQFPVLDDWEIFEDCWEDFPSHVLRLGRFPCRMSCATRSSSPKYRRLVVEVTKLAVALNNCQYKPGSDF